MNSSKLGILAIIIACFIWGFAPIYYKLLATVPPLELNQLPERFDNLNGIELNKNEDIKKEILNVFHKAREELNSDIGKNIIKTEEE